MALTYEDDVELQQAGAYSGDQAVLLDAECVGYIRPLMGSFDPTTNSWPTCGCLYASTLEGLDGPANCKDTVEDAVMYLVSTHAIVLRAQVATLTNQLDGTLDDLTELTKKYWKASQERDEARREALNLPECATRMQQAYQTHREAIDRFLTDVALDNKLQAIQLLRSWNPLGLKDAKDYIEALTASYASEVGLGDTHI